MSLCTTVNILKLPILMFYLKKSWKDLIKTFWIIFLLSRVIKALLSPILCITSPSFFLTAGALDYCKQVSLNGLSLQKKPIRVDVSESYSSQNYLSCRKKNRFLLIGDPDSSVSSENRKNFHVTEMYLYFFLRRNTYSSLVSEKSTLIKSKSSCLWDCYRQAAFITDGG